MSKHTNVLVSIDSTPDSVDPLSLSMRMFKPVPRRGIVFRAGLIAAGGVGGYIYSIVGALPAELGATLDGTTGIITGTPTDIGVFRFVAQVEDASSTVATGEFSIEVVSRLRGENVTPIDGMLLYPYRYQLTVTGATGTVTWTADGSLPNGLSMSSAGLITGHPLTPAGITYFSVTATDSGTGDTLTIPVRLTVLPQFQFAGTLSVSIRATIPWSQDIRVGFENGVEPILYRAIIPAGHEWLTYDPVTFKISGTPPATEIAGGMFTVGYVARDARGFEASGGIEITVINPPNGLITTKENGTTVDEGATIYDFVDGDNTQVEVTDMGSGLVQVRINATGGVDSGGGGGAGGPFVYGVVGGGPYTVGDAFSFAPTFSGFSLAQQTTVSSGSLPAGTSITDQSIAEVSGTLSSAGSVACTLRIEVAQSETYAGAVVFYTFRFSVSSSVVTTWDSATKGLYWTLSSGDHVADKALGGAGTYTGIRGTVSHDAATADHYFEIDVIGSQYDIGGVCLSTESFAANYPGKTNDGWGIYFPTARTTVQPIHNDVIGSSYSVPGSSVALQSMGYLVRAGKLYAKIPGQAYINSGDPDAGTGYLISGITGDVYPAMGIYNIANSRLRTSAADIVDLPSGSSPWDS